MAKRFVETEYSSGWESPVAAGPGEMRKPRGRVEPTKSQEQSHHSKEGRQVLAAAWLLQAAVVWDGLIVLKKTLGSKWLQWPKRQQA